MEEGMGHLEHAVTPFLVKSLKPLMARGHVCVHVIRTCMHAYMDKHLKRCVPKT